jgi:hypothetical protein
MVDQKLYPKAWRIETAWSILLRISHNFSDEFESKINTDGKKGLIENWPGHKRNIEVQLDSLARPENAPKGPLPALRAAFQQLRISLG